jgi:uncharacterized protein YbcI
MPIEQRTTHGNQQIDAAELAQLADISSAIKSVYTEQFGREPGRTHSHYVGADTIACFLRGTLTRAERRLTTLDEHQRLRDMRMLFQYSAEEEFRAAVEAITGRTVVAFISGIDTRADIASEIFLLEGADRPEGGNRRGDPVAVTSDTG